MIDRHLQPLLKSAYQAPARFLVRRGVSADALTLAGFGLGLAGSTAIALHLFGWGLALVLANRSVDGLDGAVARQAGPTDRGAFLDIALDFFFYASVPLGFALADPAADALPAAVLLFGFIGTGSSFLAFAAIEARRGTLPVTFRNKGLHYLGGLTEGFETIVVFVAMCLWPGGFAALALGFAALCLVTTATRWWWGWQAFAPR